MQEVCKEGGQALPLCILRATLGSSTAPSADAVPYSLALSEKLLLDVLSGQQQMPLQPPIMSEPDEQSAPAEPSQRSSAFDDVDLSAPTSQVPH